MCDNFAEMENLGYVRLTPTSSGTLEVALLCPGPLLSNYFWSVWVPRHLFECSMKVNNFMASADSVIDRQHYPRFRDKPHLTTAQERFVQQSISTARRFWQRAIDVDDSSVLIPHDGYTPQLKQWIDGQTNVNLVWHHFPLQMHGAAALKEARLVQCAGKLGGVRHSGMRLSRSCSTRGAMAKDWSRLLSCRVLTQQCLIVVLLSIQRSLKRSIGNCSWHSRLE
ncbi:hypothetical protein I9018_24385 [Pseudomonas sp. MPFS]|uniref:DsbA family protein n=1 Tax=Pseudomonas sp. MPFS TaxID=2795724 RepID=UPI001F138802|nr:DsbA family protein [Pseudomonas sp. MPFS]UMZ10601.1 hypothetical protein I9018_24385 [Pseudomonas sp. MPFS]